MQMNVVKMAVASVILGVAGVALGLMLPDSQRPHRGGGIGEPSQTSATR